MPITVITDGPDEGPGATRADFPSATDIGFEVGARVYTATVLQAHQVSGIQPNDFDAIVERNLGNVPQKTYRRCEWGNCGMDADMGRHLMVGFHVLAKLELASRGLHVADADDASVAWVEVSLTC